jgi:uncharacterized protein GlcG (DUF336 family)
VYFPSSLLTLLLFFDTHGTLVHEERGDGMLYNNMHTSMLKAQTALQTREPTSIRDAQLSDDPSGLPRQVVHSISSPTPAS